MSLHFIQDIIDFIAVNIYRLLKVKGKQPYFFFLCLPGAVMYHFIGIDYYPMKMKKQQIIDCTIQD